MKLWTSVLPGPINGKIRLPPATKLDQHSIMMQPQRAHHGFTLIELIITVIIIGVLTAVAVPSFLDQVRKGRRSDAFDAMARVQQDQERYRSQHLKYAEALGDLKLPSNSAGGHYTLSLTDVTAHGFKLTATPVSGSPQAGDKDCASFTLTVSRGTQTRSATATGGADTSTRCWPQ